MTDLFANADEPLRERLRARGWHERGGLVNGRYLWQRPEERGGGLVDEDEAFRQLAALEAEEAKR